MQANRRLLFCVVMVTVFSAAHAQRSINVHDHLLIRDSNKYLYGDPEEVYEGSPFLNDSLVLSYVYLGKEKFLGVPMRYNVYADIMEFQHVGERFLLEADPRISKIEIGKRIFVVKDFKFLAKKQNGFLELLEGGKVSLMAKKVVNYRKKVEIKGIPAKYAMLPDVYYYQTGDLPPARVGSIKNFIESMPDKQQELTEFAKAEKISGKDRADLVKLVRYYNSLSPAQ